MGIATLTSKGQVTIPAEVRLALGLKPQDQLRFTVMPDGSVVMRAKTRSLNELRGVVEADPSLRVSIDDMRLR